MISFIIIQKESKCQLHDTALFVSSGSFSAPSSEKKKQHQKCAKTSETNKKKG